jgi:HPt (histidine-containing phosphotransfer) domain-containing protein
MDDLHAIFVPRFVASARARLTRARADARRHERDATLKTTHDLHTIAGDAGLLGLTEIARMASACEQSAKQARESGSDAELDALAESLDELAAAIEGLGKQD